VFMFNPAKSTE